MHIYQHTQRLALVSAPRSGNTWLRRLLACLFRLEEHAAHTPQELNWDGLSKNCIIQLHWPATQPFAAQLARYDFKVVGLVRHPLDTLISILHFATHEPQTSHWLDGAYGDEHSIVGAEPCSEQFAAYATGSRARALIGISSEWTRRSDICVRFEDLVFAPAKELQRVIECSGMLPVTSPAKVINDFSFAPMQREVTNHHFWQGNPGLWRSLLPAKDARAISRPYHNHALQYGYDLVPNARLTRADAQRKWADIAVGG
jgi:hypothetical protein